MSIRDRVCGALRMVMTFAIFPSFGRRPRGSGGPLVTLRDG